jgi:predicted NAD/FAD-binding protein
LSSIISFFQNHKLFNFINRPQWKTVKGGSKNYINKLIQASHFDIKKSFKIDKIIRDQGVEILSQNKKYQFDLLVLACPPHHFLPLLGDKKEKEVSILNAFNFQKNLAQLHQNSSLMPPHKAAWSSWNFHTNTNNKCTLSYWMNLLQPLDTQDEFFVSLNQNQTSNLYQTVYEHPIFSLNTLNSQKEIGKIQGLSDTFYVGSYLGYGFHEDGIQSALKVCKKLNINLGRFNEADTSRIQWN